MLQRLREEFHHNSQGGGRLSIEAAARRWHHLAREHKETLGELDMEKSDREAIALRIAQLLCAWDMEQKGWLNAEEWIHHVLLATSPAAATQVQRRLTQALQREPKFLPKMQALFQVADTQANGTLTHKQVTEMYAQKLWRFRPGHRNETLSDAELNQKDPSLLARQVIDDMDVDGDGCVSYTEFAAYCVGRRKTEVIVHMYDLSTGLAKKHPWLFGEELPCIWHTGVVVFGREYFFSSDTVYDVPGFTSFGTPTRKVSMGYTLWSVDEMHGFIVSELQPVFHRATYDVVQNNCNHFSDRLCEFLVGRSIPEDVRVQSDLLMKMKAVRAARPFLNWLIRDGVVSRKAPLTKRSDLEWSHVWSGSQHAACPPPGTVVGIHPGWGHCDGPAVQFGIVVRDISLHSRQGQEQIQMPFLICNATGLEVASQAEGHALVRFFELRFDTKRGLVGQVRTELVPVARLSHVELTETAANAYDAATRAMMYLSANSFSGASRGEINAQPVLPPRCMHSIADESGVEEDDSRRHRETTIAMQARRIPMVLKTRVNLRQRQEAFKVK
mmetsp:Transcript_50751/g.110132  ORF Transcript_50751/g.110132 Transcript_50751/m.110132 type:complete len:557 (-) Transcript_50751:110-1780(-)